MRANCWMGKQKLSVERVPDPKILNARDAIVKVTATTICGSDLHLYNGFMPTMQRGDILGHEFMGEVVEVGNGVGNLKPGDRVVVPFAIACGNCESCELGNFSCCENANPNGWMNIQTMGSVFSFIDGQYAEQELGEKIRTQFTGVRNIDTEAMSLRSIFTTLARHARITRRAER